MILPAIRKLSYRRCLLKRKDIVLTTPCPDGQWQPRPSDRPFWLVRRESPRCCQQWHPIAGSS